MESCRKDDEVIQSESVGVTSNVFESKPTTPNIPAKTIKSHNPANEAPPLHCLTISTSLPKLDENVTCVGFPQGGTQISVTRGVVSRIDVNSQYVLRIQIDAAINSGNSGGPVFDEHGQVVGVASSVLRGAGNIGYIVPGKIVSMFLEMTQEPKHVPGIPSLAIHGAQTLESKALRKSLGLEELGISGGIRVIGVRGDNKLQANDVLLTINNIEIGMDGSIQLSPTRPDERINFRSIVTSKRVGSKVALDVLRDRQRKTLEVTLGITQFIVPQYDSFDACPLYAVCGGCVFSPLSLPLISEKTGKRKNTSSTFNRFYQDQRDGNDQILILSKVLADEVNVGYHGWSNLLLKSVNGFEPKNIQELVDVIVRRVKSEMVEFRCQMVGLEEADFVICMKMQEVLETEQRILHRHMIASWCSTDALPLGLKEEVGDSTRSDAERAVCWKSLKSLRAVLK
ncbi:hypothetical protein ACHAXS_002804 [Conticribra weissflogii]